MNVWNTYHYTASYRETVEVSKKFWTRKWENSSDKIGLSVIKFGHMLVYLVIFIVGNGRRKRLFLKTHKYNGKEIIMNQWLRA